MFFAMLYNIIIMPIIMLVDFVFSKFNRMFSNPGLAILGVSIVINFLVLPLYIKSDALQMEEREKQKALEPGIAHIKATFKGDERYMMLQTFYRQKHYKQYYAIRSSLSLLLQIPFFIAAYRFLSHAQALAGTSLGPISDLSRPDGLLQIGTARFNLLPVVMTLFNLVSGYVFTKGATRREKIQVAALAAFFLVFLYRSPSGLVFYWTLNQVFSLAKNIVLKIKINNRYKCFIPPVVVMVLTGILVFQGRIREHRQFFLIVIVFLISCIPVISKYSGGKLQAIFGIPQNNRLQSNIVTFLASLILTVLLGIMIPVSVITASPDEFVNMQSLQTPLKYIVDNGSIYFGIFVFWGFLIIYHLINYKKRILYTLLIVVLTVWSILDFMVFSKNFGNLSSTLVYEKELRYTSVQKYANAVVLLLATIIVVVLFKVIKQQTMIMVTSVVLCAVIGLSAVNCQKTQATYLGIKKAAEDAAMKSGNGKYMPLSRNGKNVVVIILDRAVGLLLPFILEERPQLKEIYDGFTFYPNTASFGKFTIICAPSLYGGYDYTPAEFERRDDELLRIKHNESLKALPRFFSEHGARVNICQPPYADYKMTSDLSIYNDLENVSAHYVEDGSCVKYLPEELQKKATGSEDTNRRFFYYSLMKTMPNVMQHSVYDEGKYLAAESNTYLRYYLNIFSAFYAMPYMTEIHDDDRDTFFTMHSVVTHPDDDPNIQMPSYEFQENADNSQFRDGDYMTVDGRTLSLSNDRDLNHYTTLMASLLKIGEWIQYIKEQGVYDNTKIIIAADHGTYLDSFPELDFYEGDLEANYYNPLLMVKDFDQSGFKTDQQFMTIADVADLATNQISDKAVNPYTGKTFSGKTRKEKIYVSTSIIPNAKDYMGTDTKHTFDTSDGSWYYVGDDIFKEENWTYDRPGDVGK